MDYRLISNFHPLSTPSNAVCKLSFSTGVRPYRPQPYRPQQDDNNVKEKKYFIGHILVNLELLRQNVFFSRVPLSVMTMLPWYVNLHFFKLGSSSRSLSILFYHAFVGILLSPWDQGFPSQGGVGRAISHICKSGGLKDWLFQLICGAWIVRRIREKRW